ncbi:MAG: PAS domain S-box protein [Dehalococcoidales bacterium]|nr:PAS domain S-box protein [Dehalococcoidales bacterium]
MSSNKLHGLSSERITSQRGFWLISGSLVLITALHLARVQYPLALADLFSVLGISAVIFERWLYLFPIVLAGWYYGWKVALVVSAVSLVFMSLRVYLQPVALAEQIFGIVIVLVLGDLIALGASALRRQRQYLSELESARRDLRISEASFRYLFENAHDAILIHDLDGNIITVNKAAERLTGYSRDELKRMNIRSILSPESMEIAEKVGRQLLNDEEVEQPYEERIFRHDGSEAYIQLATSLLYDHRKPVAFQHIARDITEQKRMNESLRFYFQQAIRAQEEERKRISHELHDDTIQSLVVLSRQLDALANQPGLLPEMRKRLEDLWHQTDAILQGVRHLSQDLRPPALDRLGLLAAIEMLASEVSKYSGITARVSVAGKEHRLTEEVTIALFRITQEALRNVWRHSGATRAEIMVEFTEGKTRICIIDNGKGFQVPEQMSNLAKYGKLGLAGMHERAQLIGGTLTVRSVPGAGTTIIIEAPS